MTKATPQRSLGAQISAMLKDRGVETIFGIPGVHNQELYRGIEDAGLRHVLARHEQGAGFMADGYARATGRPGVAYVITGPGLCNIMTPMGQAYSDSVPVLVLSSCLDDTTSRRGQLHQMLDQRAAADTVCDWSVEAQSPQAAYDLIDRAFVEFASKRARPKHIQLPIHLLEGPAGADWHDLPPVKRPAGNADDAAREIAAALKTAQKPLFILGGGAVSGADGWAQVIEKSGSAAFMTYAGRGILPADMPRNFGATLAHPESETIIADADLVVVVGTELSEGDLWREHFGQAKHLIRVDIDPEVLNLAVRADTPILADGAAVAHALLNHPLNPAKGWKTNEISALKERWTIEVTSQRPGIQPICDALSTALPDDTMIYSDMTQFAYVAKVAWDMPHAGHWHHPTGFGTLGYALPAAIGGAVGRRGPTLAIAGDYGFQYTLQELGVAVELGLSLPILIWDNERLKEIEDSMIGAQIAPNAVQAKNPDFIALAKAYGANATRPDSLDALVTATLDAFKADGPTLIHITADIAER